MNLADLTAVLAFLSGSISSAIYTYNSGVPWWATILLLVWGLFFGVIAAFGAGKIAYWLLMDRSASKFVSAVKFMGYMIWPIPAMMLSILGAFQTTALFIR